MKSVSGSKRSIEAERTHGTRLEPRLGRIEIDGKDRRAARNAERGEDGLTVGALTAFDLHALDGEIEIRAGLGDALLRVR